MSLARAARRGSCLMADCPQKRDVARAKSAFLPPPLRRTSYRTRAPRPERKHLPEENHDGGPADSRPLLKKQLERLIGNPAFPKITSLDFLCRSLFSSRFTWV